MENGDRFRPDPTSERARQAREKEHAGKVGVDREKMSTKPDGVALSLKRSSSSLFTLSPTHKWTSRYTSGRLACVVVAVFAEATRSGMKERVQERRRRRRRRSEEK